MAFKSIMDSNYNYINVIYNDYTYEVYIFTFN